LDCFDKFLKLSNQISVLIVKVIEILSAMKRVENVVVAVTLYAIIFNVCIYTGVPYRVVFFMFFLSPFLVIYMVYAVLKYGKPSGHTFDERFYDDWDY
jgi:hypothetical protein